jgi:phytoene/squalene synthetase
MKIAKSRRNSGDSALMFRDADRGFCVQGVLSSAHRRTHTYALYAWMRIVAERTDTIASDVVDRARSF